MKKHTFLFLLTALLVTQYGYAQPHGTMTKDQLVEALTSKGGRVSLESDKELLEPNEAAALNIMLLVPPSINQQSGEANGDAYSINLPTGADPNLPLIYKARNWKILEGGGSLVRIDDNSYSYNAPAAEPPGAVMTISVELYPVGNTLPKVILLKTLYFSNSETAIVVNLPAGGINSRKYVNKIDGGVKVPTMQTVDPRVAGHLTPELQQKMAEAQQKVAAAQQSSGLDLSAVTSNAVALYDATSDCTTIKFTSLSLQLYNGKPAPTQGADVLYTIIFKGKGVGNHLLLQDEKSGMTMVISPTKVCFCGSNDPSAHDKVLCSGTVTIKSADDRFTTGYFMSKIFTAVGKTIYQGFIHGKFKVRTANLQQ